MEAKQTPLIDLLQAVPANARLVVEDGPYSTSFHPVGSLCHEAAAILRERLAQPDKKQRQWQGLSRLEFQKAVEGLEDLEDCWIAIESALREKNT